MSKTTPLFDHARSAVDVLYEWAKLPDDDLPSLTSRLDLDVAIANAAGVLAIVEALHGVVYVANANAV